MSKATATELHNIAANAKAYADRMRAARAMEPTRYDARTLAQLIERLALALAQLEDRDGD